MTARGINAKGEAVTERPNRLIPDGQVHPLTGSSWTLNGDDAA